MTMIETTKYFNEHLVEIRKLLLDDRKGLVRHSNRARILDDIMALIDDFADQARREQIEKDAEIAENMTKFPKGNWGTDKIREYNSANQRTDDIALLIRNQSNKND